MASYFDYSSYYQQYCSRPTVAVAAHHDDFTSSFPTATANGYWAQGCNGSWTQGCSFSNRTQSGCGASPRISPAAGQRRLVGLQCALSENAAVSFVPYNPSPSPNNYNNSTTTLPSAVFRRASFDYDGGAVAASTAAAWTSWFSGEQSASNNGIVTKQQPVYSPTPYITDARWGTAADYQPLAEDNHRRSPDFVVPPLHDDVASAFGEPSSVDLPLLYKYPVNASVSPADAGGCPADNWSGDDVKPVISSPGATIVPHDCHLVDVKPSATDLATGKTTTTASKRPRRRQTKEALVPLISRAILSSASGSLKATLGEICRYISGHSGDYSGDEAGTWQNNVRHTLSHYEFFIKCGRIPTGRGNFWTVHPVVRDAFASGDFRIKRARHAVQQHEKRAILGALATTASGRCERTVA